MPNPTRMRRVSGSKYPMLAAHLTKASSQRFTVTDNTTYALGAGVDMTIAAWVYIDSSGSGEVFGREAGAGNRLFRMFINATPNWSFRTSADGTAVVTTTSGTPTVGAWHFVCCWYDGTNQNFSINNGTTNSSAQTVIVNAAQALEFGGNANNGTFLDGRLDCAGHWITATGGGGALSAAQRTALYNGGVGLAYRDLSPSLLTGLVGWWNFDGNARDSTSKANTLTAVNAPTYTIGKR